MSSTIQLGPNQLPMSSPVLKRQDACMHVHCSNSDIPHLVPPELQRERVNMSEHFKLPSLIPTVIHQKIHFHPVHQELTHKNI